MSKKRKYAIDLSGDSVTQQQFKHSSDVNNIVAHFHQTGFDPYEARKEKIAFGYATSKDFTQAMRDVAEINSAFAELTAEERSSFSNDPSRWIDSLATQPQGVEAIVQEAASEAADPVAPPPENGEKSD